MPPVFSAMCCHRPHLHHRPAWENCGSSSTTTRRDPRSRSGSPRSSHRLWSGTILVIDNLLYRDRLVADFLFKPHTASPSLANQGSLLKRFLAWFACPIWRTTSISLRAIFGSPSPGPSSPNHKLYKVGRSTQSSQRTSLIPLISVSPTWGDSSIVSDSLMETRATWRTISRDVLPAC